jgi:hypothetical protein
VMLVNRLAVRAGGRAPRQRTGGGGVSSGADMHNKKITYLNNLLFLFLYDVTLIAGH